MLPITGFVRQIARRWLHRAEGDALAGGGGEVVEADGGGGEGDEALGGIGNERWRVIWREQWVGAWAGGRLESGAG